MLYQILQTNIVRIVRQTENWITIIIEILGVKGLNQETFSKSPVAMPLVFKETPLMLQSSYETECSFCSPFWDFIEQPREAFKRITVKDTWTWVTSFPYPLYPLHPNISIHSLDTLLYTFPLSLTRRIHLTINAFNVGNHISFILVILMDDSAVFL